MSNGGGRARSSDPPPSHGAIGSGGVAALEGRVVAFLRSTYPRDWSALDIARQLDEHPWSISPRMVPLEEKRLVQRTGMRPCVNISGRARSMVTWRARQTGDWSPQLALPLTPSPAAPAVATG